MKNLKEIKTTVIGAVLFLIGIAFFAVNFKTLNSFEISQVYVPVAFAVVGILFLLAPDRILDVLFTKIDKKP